MATFSFEVSPYRRADGTHAVKIRMTHNRKTLRKATGVYVSDAQLTRDRSRVRDPAVAEALDAMLASLRRAAAQVDGARWMDAATLWRAVSSRMGEAKGFSLDFFEFARECTAHMERGTADGYRWALNALRRYLGRDTLDVNEIDRAMVEGFRSWIERRNGKGCRAASAYLEKLRYVHSRARELYNDEDTGVVRVPRQPFKRGVIPQQPATRHRSLTLAQLRSVLSCQPVTSRGKMAQDVFALSLSLIGMNTADLYLLGKGDVRGGVVTYGRAKTDSRRGDGAVMSVRVEREAAVVMARWRGVSRPLRFADRYADFRGFNRAVNVGLKEVGRLCGVPGLTSYHARHTWATLARNECGVAFDTVHEALDHARRGAERVTDIYVERDWTRVWDANRRVLDLVGDLPIFALS